MALIIYDNRIEISIPNSEAMICAQHVGIKDRTVGSYYMSESAGDVIAFLNNLKGEFYIDFYRTIQNMEKLYRYIEDVEKQELFKTELMDQYMNQAEIEKSSLTKHYIKIDQPTVNSNMKYLKLNRSNREIDMFQNLLLGDVTKIVIFKLSKNCFILYGDLDDNYKYKIDNSFKIK